MPPQLKSQFDPANKIPAPENILVQQKPSRGYSFLIVVMVLLLITGVFGVWYFSNPLPDEDMGTVVVDQFADWKTYRNEEYGYEIKYTPEFTSKIPSVNDYWSVWRGAFYNGKYEAKVKDFWGATKNESSSIEESIAFTVYDSVINASSTLSASSDILTLSDFEPIKIGNNKAYKIEAQPEGPFNYNVLYIIPTEKNTITLSFSILGKDVNYPGEYLQNLIEEYKTLSENSISTFKFISTSTPVTEGKFCGGIAPGAFPCPTGYICKLDGTYPDAGGHCVVPDGTGTLAGRVTIGPNCPVEQVDNPCVTPPEAYASREFSITQNGKVITTFHADSSGNYIVSIAPGTYIVSSAKTGMGFVSKDLPATIIIKADEATTLNIDIDTGIR